MTRIDSKTDTGEATDSDASSAFLLRSRAQALDRPIIVQSSATQRVKTPVAVAIELGVIGGATASAGGLASASAASGDFVDRASATANGPVALLAEHSMRVRADRAVERRSAKRRLAAVSLAAIVILSALGVAQAPLFGEIGKTPGRRLERVQAWIEPGLAGRPTTSTVVSQPGSGDRTTSARLAALASPREPAGYTRTALMIKPQIANGSVDQPVAAGAAVAVAAVERPLVREVRSAGYDADSASIQKGVAAPLVTAAKAANHGTKRKSSRKVAAGRKPATITTALNERTTPTPVLPDTLKP